MKTWDFSILLDEEPTEAQCELIDFSDHPLMGTGDITFSGDEVLAHIESNDLFTAMADAFEAVCSVGVKPVAFGPSWDDNHPLPQGAVEEANQLLLRMLHLGSEAKGRCLHQPLPQQNTVITGEAHHGSLFTSTDINGHATR